MNLIGRVLGAPGISELTFEKERIRSVAPAPAGTAPTDLIIAPAFIDVQVNGYGGLSLSGPGAAPDTLPYMVRALRRVGVLFFFPTLTTESPENMLRAVRAIATARRDPEVAHATPFIHLEGPYISTEDGPRGAHPREHVRPPNWEEFQRLQDAAEGRVGIVTLGAEYPGSTRFIEQLVEAGVVAALGHTGATPAQIRDAIRAGARLSTHLGNGSHALIDRHQNYIWEQLAADELYASLIADGHHLPPSVLKCMIRCKGVARTILTSDAVAAAGLPPGVYSAEGREIEVLPNGRVQLAGTPFLAGSGLVLPKSIENAVRFAGVSLDDAVRMVTLNPARLMGLEERLGSIAPGKEASLTLFRWNEETASISIAGVVWRGQVVTVEEMGDVLRPAGSQAF
ncbi:MAG: N-acetylglucosamine-6-phosphate deacetylase [Armatimonadota bacterium]|nr:N-acetylglucosamine-6-phosphate deacetylase [Armatimonadota bacterium]